MADKQTDQKLFMILGEGEETPTARATRQSAAHCRKAFTDENRALAIRVGQAKLVYLLELENQDYQGALGFGFFFSFL